MRYYTPRWMAVVGLLASLASAFQLPMFGFILAQYVFVLSMPVGTEEELAAFVHERDVWTWAFVVGLAVVTVGGAVEDGK